MQTGSSCSPEYPIIAAGNGQEWSFNMSFVGIEAQREMLAVLSSYCPSSESRGLHVREVTGQCYVKNSQGSVRAR